MQEQKYLAVMAAALDEEPSSSGPAGAGTLQPSRRTSGRRRSVLFLVATPKGQGTSGGNSAFTWGQIRCLRSRP